jgi:hypothetical protein
MRMPSAGHINAPSADVHRALLAAGAASKWKVPDGMSCNFHEFDGREGAI